MQKGIGATSSKSSLLHKAIACLLSIILIMSYSSIAYALDEDETTEATATEQQADSSSVSTDESVSSEEAADTEESAAEEAETEETSDSDDTTDDAVSLEVPTISALSEVSLFNVKYSYIDAEGNEKSSAATVVTSDFSGTWSDTDTNGGWYIVTEDTTISSRITCSGDINLILADGATLTASAGIAVNDGEGTLTIYAQSTDETTMGSLAATGATSYAGIGGDILTLNGSITINGGNITATGGYYAAGIGGGNGWNSDGGTGQNITINGGTVTATGSYDGAGIGGGHEGSADNITISGGTVTATGGYAGAGIGTGRYGSTAVSATNILISGGTVTASSPYGPGIGGTWGASEIDVTISGGVVTASGTGDDAAIGGGDYTTTCSITITGGIITASSANNVAIGINTNNGAVDQAAATINYANGGFYYRTSDSGVFTYQANTDFTATTSYLQIYPAASASFNSDSLTISSGTSLNLNEYLAITLENYTSGSYTWTSSDSSVVSVDASGTITALSAGTATIGVEIPITIEGQTATPLTAEITIVVPADNTGGAASTDTSLQTGGTSTSSSSGTSAGSTGTTSASADTSDTSTILPKTGAAQLPYLLVALIVGCLVSAAVALCKLRKLREC